MNPHQQVQRSEIWAQLFLCNEDRARIRDFFVKEIGIERSYIARQMHVTVYHALGPMPGVGVRPPTTAAGSLCGLAIRTTKTITICRELITAPMGDYERVEGCRSGTCILRL